MVHTIYIFFKSCWFDFFKKISAPFDPTHLYTKCQKILYKKIIIALSCSAGKVRAILSLMTLPPLMGQRKTFPGDPLQKVMGLLLLLSYLSQLVPHTIFDSQFHRSKYQFHDWIDNRARLLAHTHTHTHTHTRLETWTKVRDQKPIRKLCVGNYYISFSLQVFFEPKSK